MPASGSSHPPLLPFPPASRVCSAAKPQVLNHIRQTAWDMAVWKRQIPAAFMEAGRRFARKPGSVLLDARVSSGSELTHGLEMALAGCQDQEWQAWLTFDIQHLAGIFLRILECITVRVRLQRVVDAGCAVFHVDTLSARLLCTYAGAGMEWADEPDVRRHELGLNGRSIADANAAIVPDSARIQELVPGAVGILKGRLWPDGSPRGLVHRSPPGCCAEDARLRLLIDPGDRPDSHHE